MAKYNRKFLIPYLQDVCTAEMLCAKVAKELEDCRMTLAQCRRQIDNLSQSTAQKLLPPVSPERDEYKVYEIGRGILAIVGVILFLLGCHCSNAPDASDSLAFVLRVGGAICAVVGFCGWAAADGKYENAREAHSSELRTYNKQVQRQIQDADELAKITAVYDDNIALQAVLENRLNKAQELRSSIYDVNVIPKTYRNEYVAYYLYDYFQTSRETDLDKIIQTLLLDKIERQLGSIVKQNGQIILNQRVQIALQEEHNRVQAEQHREEMERLARMEEDWEKQKDYHNMILKNQQVTNYILAADYLHNGGKLPYSVRPNSPDLPPLP